MKTGTTPYLLKGGIIVDAGTAPVEEDILLAGGRVSARGTNLNAPANAITLDVRDRFVFPGFIDMHVHLREPGREDKETIASGTRAAAAGGFTAVCAKANTFLVMDNPAVVEFVRSRALAAGFAHVFPVGSVTEGLRGYGNLSEIGSLRQAGIVALSDDGVPVVASDVMAEALRYAADFDLPVIAHSEDYDLADGGSLTEGRTALETGIAASPTEAEEIMIARDLALLEHYGGKLHVAHVSAASSLRHIRRAKAAGLDVTCETAPHYLLLTDKASARYDADAKMNPPLRSEEDRREVIAALKDGTIDCIASDHAPHTPSEKDKIFEKAPFGIVGLETTLALVYTYLVLPGIIHLSRMVELLSAFPARRLRLNGRGRLGAGDWADVVVFDPRPRGVVDPRTFYSRGRNTPFAGWKIRGRVETTFLDGRPVVWESRLVV